MALYELSAFQEARSGKASFGKVTGLGFTIHAFLDIRRGDFLRGAGFGGLVNEPLYERDADDAVLSYIHSI
jgi:hypothetical protein